MDPKEIISQLMSLSEDAKSLGDKLKALSSKSGDVDVVALITALSMQAYDLSVNVQDSVDTYREILEEDISEAEEELEINEPEE